MAIVLLNSLISSDYQHKAYTPLMLLYIYESDAQVADTEIC